MSRIYVAVDLETTGLAAESDAILEIGAVKFRLPTRADEEPMIARWSTLVNPGRPIPYNISRLTGITQEELDSAPPLHKVLDDFRHFVGNYPVVGHYVSFELSFLQRQGALIGQAHIDTFELASLLLPTAQRYSLGLLADFLSISFDEWHRALPDAEMSAHLLLALWQKALALPLECLEAIANVALESSWDLRSFFVAAYRLAAQADESDEASALLMADESAQLRHPFMSQVQLLAPQMPLVAAPDVPSQDEVAALFAQDGPIAQAMPDYEVCAEQIAILNAVMRAFENESHLMMEAGTGSGRMRAYTVAAIYEALRRGESVVIASKTFAMQKQLLMEELPFLRNCLPHPFAIHWLKKSSNYLCPRRVEMLRQRGNFSSIEARVLTRILIWMLFTESGDRSELNIQLREEQVWELLCADEESCSAERCTPYGTCYWLKACEQAAQAHLLITHHTRLADHLLSGGAFIPPYQMLIVDEAHHLEEQLTNQLGFTLWQSQLYTALDRLLSLEQRPLTGLLPLIRRHLPKKSSLVKQCERLGQLVVLCRQNIDDLWMTLAEALRHQRHQRYRYRIEAKWHYRAEWNQLAREVDTFGIHVEQLIKGLAQLQSGLSELAAEEVVWQNRVDEIRRAITSLQTLFQEIERILIKPKPNDVSWIRLYQTENNDDGQITQEFTLYRAPINLASLLQKRLFEQKRTVILTSSTLAIQGDFSFLRERLGIEQSEELSIASPYNYAQQALVYLADDLPPPNKPDYINKLKYAIVELAKATEGRMLVLFTSVSQLKNTYRAVSSSLARNEIMLLGQYMDGPNIQLIERFKTMKRAVLFGGHVFWEGLNIPGPALSCVVITRLPFPPSTEPMQAARADCYRDSFVEYQIPQTIIRFRQSFEQLLRSQNDRGIIALLDSRLKHKSYGDTMLDSLPTSNLQIGPFRYLPPLAERWLKNRGLAHHPEPQYPL